MLEQVWFAGVHCDVGGGYADLSLGEIPLLWMVRRAEKHGLAFDPDRLRVADGRPVAPERRSTRTTTRRAPARRDRFSYLPRTNCRDGNGYSWHGHIRARRLGLSGQAAAYRRAGSGAALRRARR